MGGRGGPLWQRITYACQASMPSTPPTSQPMQQPSAEASAKPAQASPGPSADPGGDAGRPISGTVSVEDSQGITRHQALPALDSVSSGAYGGSDQAFWAWLDNWLRSRRLAGSCQHLQGLPFDFWGGLVGYLGYGLKHQGCRDSSGGPLPQLPDAGLLFADRCEGRLALGRGACARGHADVFAACTHTCMQGAD